MLYPGDVVGRYAIEHPLGAGGMATVYAVRHTILGTRHALKVLFQSSETTRAQLLQEGRLQAHLDPTNIVPVTDVLEVRGELALLMPLVEGGSLDHLLRVAPLTIAEATALFQGIVAGVARAHEADVVHRDLKPSNVLLEWGGDRVVPRVADFGLARFADGVVQPDSGRFVGTPAYAAPEQLERPALVSTRSDVFSLGVMLFEMLTGFRPFSVTTPDALREEIRPPPLALSEVPPSLRSTIMRMVSPDPADRYASASALRDALPPCDPAALAAGGRIAAYVSMNLEKRDLSDVARAPTSANSSDPPRAHRLPPERDTFIGRSDALTRLDAQVTSGASLITVLGPGGAGKTRLVTRYAHQSMSRWSGGVWFCDLSTATTPDAVLHATAETFNVDFSNGAPDTRISQAIQRKGRCLVIFDNCEQIVHFAEQIIGRWSTACPDACFLATSQQVLNLPGEVLCELGSMPEEESLALFASRAQAHRPDFEIADPEVARELIQMLDGLPLAIELAAARTRLMTLHQLRERLDQRFRILVSRRGPKRQSTLRAALDWSWKMLDETEQRALAQLSVFESGFTLTAAEAIVVLPDADLITILQQLIDKSLIQRAVEDRFALLLSIRDYAAEKLAGFGDAIDVERRHGWFYARYSTPEMGRFNRIGRSVPLMRTLNQDLGNLSAATNRALSRGDAPTAAACALAASEVLYVRGPLRAAFPLVHGARQMPGAVRIAELCLAEAEVLHLTGQPNAATPLFEKALAICRADGNTRFEENILFEIGTTLHDAGRVDEAEASYQQALVLSRRNQLTRQTAITLSSLGALCHEQGRFDEAQTHYEHARDIYERLNARNPIALITGNLGSLHLQKGNLQQARRCYETAMAIHKAYRDRRGIAEINGNLGVVLLEMGLLEDAQACLEKALALHRRIGNFRDEAIVLGSMGELVHRIGDLSGAEARYQESLACYRETSAPRIEAIVRTNLGTLLIQQGRYREAQLILHDALQGHQRIQNRDWEARTLLRMSEAHRQEGSREDAAALLQQAIHLLPDLSEPRARCIVLLAQSVQQPDDVACVTIDSALRIAQTIQDRWIIGQLLIQRARRLPPGRIDDARADAHRSIQILRQIQEHHFLIEGLLVLHALAPDDATLQEARDLIQAMNLPDSAPMARRLRQRSAGRDSPGSS
ncbi:MAG: tetratricopeptide repeat protein [Myxococcota bacterium]